MSGLVAKKPKMDIRGFSWLTQGKSGEELQKKEEHLGWKWWAGHRLSLVD